MIKHDDNHTDDPLGLNNVPDVEYYDNLDQELKVKSIGCLAIFVGGVVLIIFGIYQIFFK